MYSDLAELKRTMAFVKVTGHLKEATDQEEEKKGREKSRLLLVLGEVLYTLFCQFVHA